MEVEAFKKKQSAAEHSSALESKLKKKYQDSFWYLNEGINLEERGKKREAALCYEKGLRLLEEGLKVIRSMEAREQYESTAIKRKMERAKDQVKSRLNELEQSSKEQELKVEEVSSVQTRFSMVDWEDVVELLHIPEGVQLFHVDTETGECTATPPSELKVCQFVKEYKDLRVPPAFLLCGEWMFPLDPGVSPILKSNSNTYVFPDVDVLAEPQENNSCVGLIFSSPVAEEQVSRFERILSCYSKYKDCSKSTKPKRPPPPRDIAATGDTQLAESTRNKSSISDNVNAGAQWISSGIEKGAVIGGKLVEKGAEKLKISLTSNENPTEVDPKVAENIQHVKTVTGAAMQVSGYLVSALSALTYQIGKHLAPIVREQGAKLLPDKYKTDSEEGKERVDKVVEVAVAGIQGWATIFLSLEEAGKIMYKSLSNATVGLVQHKYGSNAADATEDAMKAAGNTAMVYLNMKNLGVKAIAKRTAKDTAKTVLAIEQDNRSKNQ